MQPRYRALRIIGGFYKILAGAAAAVTLLLAIGICGFSALGGAALGSLGRELGMRSAYGGLFTSTLGGLIVAGVVILFGGGFAVTLYAVSEWIDLFLALEENTRITAQALQMQAGQELSEFSSQRPGAGGQQPPISDQQVPES